MIKLLNQYPNYTVCQYIFQPSVSKWYGMGDRISYGHIFSDMYCISMHCEKNFHHNTFIPFSIKHLYRVKHKFSKKYNTKNITVSVAKITKDIPPSVFVIYDVIVKKKNFIDRISSIFFWKMLEKKLYEKLMN